MHAMLEPNDREDKDEKNKQAATSNELRANEPTSQRANEQRATSNERRTTDNEQRATKAIAGRRATNDDRRSVYRR